MPGAEDRRRLHLRSRLRHLLGDFPDELVAEEDGHEVEGGRRLCHARERLRFDLQRVFPPPARALLHRGDRSDRRGIVGSGLPGHEALRGFERHHGFRGVELEGGDLFEPAGFPVALSRDRLLQQVQRAVAQFFGGDHRVHDAGLERHVGGILLTPGDPLDGVVGAGHAGHAHGAAPAGKDAELGLGEPDLRARRHHAVAGGQGEFQPAAEGESVDRGDGGKIEILDGAKELVHIENPRDQLIFGVLEVLDELRDVGADDEAVLAAGDQKPFDAGFRLDESQHFAQFGQGRLVEFIDGITLEVEPQLDDASGQQRALDGLAFEFHETSGTLSELW